MMKKILLLPIFCFFSFLLFSQNKADSVLTNALTLLSQKERKKAIQEFQLAKALDTNKDCQLQTLANQKIGVCYYYMAKDSLALIYWRDSTLEAMAKCFGEQDYRTIKIKTNIAFAYGELGDRAKEFHMIEEIIDSKIVGDITKKDSSGLAGNYIDFGKIYRNVQDFNKAEQCLNRAKFLLKDNTSPSKLAKLNEHLGILYNYKGLPAKAKPFLLKSIALRPSANRYYNLGHIYYNLNELDSALVYFEKAEKIYQKNEKNYRSNLGQTANFFGLIQKRKANYQQALDYIQEAYEVKRKTNKAWHPILALELENIGEIHFLQADYPKALEKYQQALAHLSRDTQLIHSLDNPRIKDIGPIERNQTIRVLGLKTKALYHFYKAKQEQKHLEIALTTAKTVDSLVRNFRLFNKRGEDKFSLSETVLPYYESSILVAKELYDNKKDQAQLKNAYQALLNIKGIVLMEEIKNKEILARYIPKKVLKEEAALREKVYSIENVLSLAKASEKIEIAEQYFLATTAYNKFLKEIAQKYPDYYQAKFDYQSDSTLTEIQAKLTDQELVIDFLEGKQALYIFGVSKHNISLEVVNNSQEIAQAIRKINESEQLTDIHQTASFLYTRLLDKTIAQHGQNLDHLIFAKSGFLYDLAFDLLRTPQQQYLIETYKLSEVYSAEQLLQDQRSKYKDHQYIGFAIDYDQLSEAQRYFLDSSAYLNKLSFVKEEIGQGQAIFDGMSFSNAQVSIPTLKDMLRQANIIHFATHALSMEDVLRSGLVVYGDEQQLAIFNKNDIMALDLANDLSILSACHTGAGKKYKGEGVMSLARAFFNAGSKSVLVSTNAASDHSAQKILVSFLKHIKEGLPKHQALQQAKIEYFQQAAPAYQHPKYWAYFSIIGNTDLITFPSPAWIKYSIVVVAALLLAGFLWYIQRRTTN